MNEKDYEDRIKFLEEENDKINNKFDKLMNILIEFAVYRSYEIYKKLERLNNED